MASNIPIPEPMICTGSNIGKQEDYFRESFEDYSVAVELEKKSDKIQVATLKSIVGRECKEILKQIHVSAETEKVKDILDKLSQHFVPKTNLLFERYKFYEATQGQNETIDAYYLRLQDLAKECDFGNKENMIRDRLVLFSTDVKARAALFRETEAPNLQKTLEYMRMSEMTKHQLDAIDQSREQISYTTSRNYTTQRMRQPATMQKNTAPKDEEIKTVLCRYCGKTHARMKEVCPAYGKFCKICNIRNHFASVCRQKPQGTVKSLDQEEEQLSSEKDYEYVKVINVEEDECESDQVVVDEYKDMIELVSEEDEYEDEIVSKAIEKAVSAVKDEIVSKAIGKAVSAVKDDIVSKVIEKAVSAVEDEDDIVSKAIKL
jgi:hypothetical protein